MKGLKVGQVILTEASNNELNLLAWDPTIPSERL